ncbi:heavy metal-binding domain-containing protein [Methylocella sp.]|uniref:heavy metal-binding domain-containing protein n=1 Tax=Methylocella sp. TaxID=1978226 RepID=UPI0035B376DC
MYVSSSEFLDGSRVLPIGKISAASAWHAEPADAAADEACDDWREAALQELIRRAEDVDADAILDVDYETDGVVPVDETGVRLRRVRAVGTAVRLGSRG